ncbi:MAG: MaoC family dehydratase [Actinomycetota bacterium]|nr:MaoC family dehydratase [Actinomycetota bacterium]
MSVPSYDVVEVGADLPEQVFPVRRADLIRYAGASGDDNVIHWNERVARAVGLPDVIAHGMLTMALAGRVVADWAGDPGRVVEYTVRFSKPVVVPDDDTGTALVVSGRVQEKRDDDRTVVVALEARVGDEKVLTGARAVVRLP